MKTEKERVRSAIRRDSAETYILTSLVGCAATVILTRVFLHLTGYPQIGNSVLHIAHALWGGLLLVAAAYVPLAYANRWALKASAVLSGIGIGLFIDEVGKFITQANDYFFPPALPLIYCFILLNVLVYLYLRRPHEEDPRAAIYHALEGLHDLLDGDLDLVEGEQVKAKLAIASRSERPEIVTLVQVLSYYLEEESEHLAEVRVNFWKRVSLWIDALGQRFGRRNHRLVISAALVGWSVLVAGYIISILWRQGSVDPGVLQWRGLLIAIQIIVGILILIGAILWLRHQEETALKFGVTGFLISLVALQLLYFYITQFSAITTTLLQIGILQVLFTYRRWYLRQG